MKKAINKKKLCLIGCAALVILAVAVFFAVKGPQRLTARQINDNTDLPYGFLSDTDYAQKGLICVDEFGTNSYFDKKYVSDDVPQEGIPETSDIAVIYYTSMWPDTVFGSVRTVRIECTDPAYHLFGCAVGDTYTAFHNALKKAGFRESGYATYEKSGITVRLDVSGAVVDSFTVRTQSTNLFGIQY